MVEGTRESKAFVDCLLAVAFGIQVRLSSKCQLYNWQSHKKGISRMEHLVYFTFLFIFFSIPRFIVYAPHPELHAAPALLNTHRQAHPSPHPDLFSLSQSASALYLVTFLRRLCTSNKIHNNSIKGLDNLATLE